MTNYVTDTPLYRAQAALRNAKEVSPHSATGERYVALAQAEALVAIAEVLERMYKWERA